MHDRKCKKVCSGDERKLENSEFETRNWTSATEKQALTNMF